MEQVKCDLDIKAAVAGQEMLIEQLSLRSNARTAEIYLDSSGNGKLKYWCTLRGVSPPDSPRRGPPFVITCKPFRGYKVRLRLLSLKGKQVSTVTVECLAMVGRVRGEKQVQQKTTKQVVVPSGTGPAAKKSDTLSSNASLALELKQFQLMAFQMGRSLEKRLSASLQKIDQRLGAVETRVAAIEEHCGMDKASGGPV